MLLGCAASAQAESWADALFPKKTHDFGSVAVASETTFRFPIRNNTGTDIHIADVRASCGCTTPIIETPWVRAGETGSILAKYNTDTFRGKKGATLTVVIDRPAYTEVRLRVDGYIRRDIVFHPGSVDFGTVAQGESKQQVVQIAYAGRDDWQIVDVQSDVPYLQTDLAQQSRGSQRVNYALTVTLSDEAPTGFLQQELVLITNDRSMPRVPLRVSGRVEAGLSVAPAAIALGSVKPGESVQQRLVVRGREPFIITSIALEGWEVEFDPPTESKTTHLVNVRLTAKAKAGEFRTPLVISTDQAKGQTARALVTGLIADR